MRDLTCLLNESAGASKSQHDQTVVIHNGELRVVLHTTNNRHLKYIVDLQTHMFTSTAVAEQERHTMTTLKMTKVMLAAVLIAQTQVGE